MRAGLTDTFPGLAPPDLGSSRRGFPNWDAGGGGGTSPTSQVDEHVLALDVDAICRQRRGLSPQCDEAVRPPWHIPPSKPRRPVPVLAGTQVEARVVPGTLHLAAGEPHATRSGGE